MKQNKNTSWGKVANWYDSHLGDDNTYHAQVIAPNLLRVVDLKPTESLLELGCGQGYFLNLFSNVSKNLKGIDLGRELIKIARTKNKDIDFIFANAENQSILKDKNGSFDAITIILALQNMKNLSAVVKNISRLMKDNGRAVIVLNHPAFRIPQSSSWGRDEKEKIQYRRVDEYMSEVEKKIDMTPGKSKDKQFTFSYHRPLQVYSKAFAKEDLTIVKIEEWISHRKSENGPWAKAEDKSRKEIPLFMCLVLKKI